MNRPDDAHRMSPVMHAIPHPDLGGYALDLLDPTERAAFEEHLAECPACRSEVTELAPMRTLLELAALEAPPTDLEARTLTAVRAAAHAPTVADLDERRRRRRPRLLVASVAAAAVAVLTLGGVALLRDSGGSSAPTATVALRSVEGEEGHGTARITPTPHGSAVDLTVAGLDDNADGTHYECWWLLDGERVSAGTFTVGRSGRARVQLTVATHPADRMSLSVTRVEPGGGSEEQYLTAHAD